MSKRTPRSKQKSVWREKCLIYTYDAIEFIKWRMEIQLKSKAVHLEQTLRYEQRQKYELCVNCNNTSEN